MQLLDFLNEHYNNYEQILSGDPYNLKITKDKKYVMFKYDMINSDMGEPMCREARGCIFYDTGSAFKLVCYPFDKFFNYEEPANDIEPDWSTASVQEKVDGSLIKLWYHRSVWNISTNGTINAFKANAYDDVSFGDLFINQIEDIDEFLSMLNPNYTYMFELVSPQTQIVVQYPEPAIYYLGERNMFNLQERRLEHLDFAEVGIKFPEIYPLSSAAQCKEAAAALGNDKEGFVVCDGDFRRVKIKSPLYVAAHHMVGNGKLSTKKVLELVREGILDDFLGIRPNAKDFVDKVLAKYNQLESDMAISLLGVPKYDPRYSLSFCEFRKKYAEYAKQYRWYDFLFKNLDNNTLVNDYLNNLPIDKVIRLMGENDDE